ncbi:MAG: OmpH family outer membrane protein [Candidatus Fermentibacter sp.]|nr:OmpH family outer membrane protein [Candidatus Fermentibacter sp.]
MRLITIAALLLPAAAGAGTVAVLDSERIFESLGGVADARELLEAEIDEWNAHADSLQADIDAIELDLSRTLMMSPERRREREALLEEKRAELEQFLSSTFGPGGLAERRNEELVTPIVDEINEAVRELGTENGYELVLDTAGGFVVYADESLDITDLVITRMSTGGAAD